MRDSATMDSVTTKAKKRKSPAGVATNDLVFSSYVGTSDEFFPFVLSLYVPKGNTVADVTYGKGVFWRKVHADSSSSWQPTFQAAWTAEICRIRPTR